MIVFTTDLIMGQLYCENAEFPDGTPERGDLVRLKGDRFFRVNQISWVEVEAGVFEMEIMLSPDYENAGEY